MSSPRRRRDTEQSQSSDAAARVAEKAMNALPFVKWDRWLGELGTSDGITIYGWIARKDGRSDFVIIRTDNDGVYGFMTSSAKHHAKIANIYLGPIDWTLNDCKRVDEAFPGVKNVARIKEARS